MFHVKHVLGLALILVGSSSCGYQPVYSGSEPAERLAVVLAPSRVPNAEAVQAALAGARAELARSGSLRGGSGYPRLVLEITRVDDEGTGIQVVPAPGEPGDEIPLNRAGSVGVVVDHRSPGCSAPRITAVQTMTVAAETTSDEPP